MNNLLTHHFQQRLYYVSSPTDKTVLLAIDPVMEHDAIVWFDTNKERIKPIFKITDDSEGHFSFITYDDQGASEQYTFIPLTVTLYEQQIKRRLKDPRPYQNERHLFELLLATKKSAW
jgi:hypothetical protein